MNIGTAVRGARAALGMRSAEAAGRIGISPTYLTRIEIGHQAPSPRVEHQIARGLKTTVLSLKLRATAEHLAADCLAGEYSALDDDASATLIELSLTLAELADDAADIDERNRPLTHRERARRLFGSSR